MTISSLKMSRIGKTSVASPLVMAVFPHEQKIIAIVGNKTLAIAVL